MTLFTSSFSKVSAFSTMYIKTNRCQNFLLLKTFSKGSVFSRGRGGTSYNGLYGEAPPERVTFFTLQVYERVGISRVVVYETVGKSIIYVFKRAFHYFPMEGIRKGYHLLLEGIRKGYLFCQKWYIKG